MHTVASRSRGRPRDNVPNLHNDPVLYFDLRVLPFIIEAGSRPLTSAPTMFFTI